MTNKEIRKAITGEFASVPEQQISFGVYLHTVGDKYVTIMNCRGKTTLEKIPLEAFDGIGEDVECGDMVYRQSFKELLDEYEQNKW